MSFEKFNPETYVKDNLQAEESLVDGFIDYMAGPGREQARAAKAAPDLDDKQFASTWFAVLEYKTMLEQQLYALTRKASGPLVHVPHLKKWQKLYVSNSSANIEEQRYIYDTLAQLTGTLDQWTPRAVELDLF